MKDCIFCKIVKGEIPAEKIWENENHLAFLDMNPINEGHALVIPKKHEDYLFDLNDEEYSELMLSAKEVAKMLKEKMNSKRVGVIVEGFMIPHVHIHLIPINTGSDMNVKGAKKIDPEELKNIGEKIRG